MKLLEGYVENRTQEAALAAMMLALFFVTRTFKIQISPAFGFDFVPAVIFSASTILSWPYTVLFSLSVLYKGTTPLTVLSFFIGTQVAFFLRKAFKDEWAHHAVTIAGIISAPSYGVILHLAGMMDIRAFFAVATVSILISNIATAVGGKIFWVAFRRFNIVDEAS